MGTFADSLFTVLMSWVRGLVSAIWALFSSDHTTALEFLGKNWLMIAVVIVGAGLVIDWIIWLLRWQPYHLWAHRARRLLRMEEPAEEEETNTRAHAAVMPQRKQALREDRLDESVQIERYAPPAPELDMEQEQQVFQQASSAPDEYAYPGMRYDSTVTQELGSTQRYGAVTQEGPGAAEVARRKAEIEAWQLHMQEEARARAEAERAQREEEQARLARQAYEEEQARLAQEEYERQLAEYERQKAQYERDMAEYERQKAEYEAQLARENAMQEASQELAPQQTRRRRSAQKSYSDYVEGDVVQMLPDAAQWPQMNMDLPAAAPEKAQTKPKKHSRLLDQMARMIEPEEEEIAMRTKLPPRVDMHDAYKPAAAPRKPGRRNP